MVEIGKCKCHSKRFQLLNLVREREKKRTGSRFQKMFCFEII